MESMVRRREDGDATTAGRGGDRSAPWSTWLLTAIAMLALVIAASSDTVRIWTNPEPSGSEPPAIADRDDEPSRPAPEPTESGDHAWLGAVLQVVAGLMFAAIVISGLYAASQSSPSLGRLRRVSPERRRSEFAEPLPEGPERAVRVDADAARASLSAGPPRNAIVRCWMRLEADVAAAGLPRQASETSSEFAERVIGRSSVDPRPITELAALYREARFSVHELGDDHRERAALALDRVVAALRSHQEVGR